MSSIKLGKRVIDNNSEPYIIAEVGVNHEGSFEQAVDLINLAKEGGADAVKYQSYKAETLASIDSPAYWDTEEEKTTSQFNLFKKYDKFNSNDYASLAKHCKKIDIDFVSTPFDEESVEYLDKLVPYYKIASADINNVPLIDAVMKTKKPIIVSTGYCEFSEVQSVYKKLESEIEEFAILHCVAKYPAEIENMNLSNLTLFKDSFSKARIGFSDHSKDVNIVPAVAYGAGARIFEKHFTLDNSLPGYDHKMSLNPQDFEKMCNTLRACELASGKTRLDTGTLDVENERKLSARRSVYYNQDVKSGSTLTEKHLIALRPGSGVSVSEWESIKGLVLKKTKKAGQRFEWNDVK